MAFDLKEEGGAYQQAISVLYAVAYTLKMSYKTDYKIEGFFEYVDRYLGSDIMINGDTIQVSRGRRKPFLDALNEYLNEVGK